MIISLSGYSSPVTTIGVAPPITHTVFVSTARPTLPRATGRNVEAQNSSGATNTSNASITTDAASRGTADDRSNLALRLGLGVGIPVGVVLVGGLLLLFLRRERRLRGEISELKGTKAGDNQNIHHRPPNYTTMGFPPQELERQQQHSRSWLFAEAPESARRQRSRHEMTTLEPAAHELSGRRPSPLPR